MPGNYIYIYIYIAELILQPFHHSTYVTTHSLTLPSLYLRHSSFSNPSVASPTSVHSPSSNLSVTSSTLQLILQPFPRITYVTAHSPTLLSLHLCHSSFPNPSFASPTSQALTYVTWWTAQGPILFVYVLFFRRVIFCFHPPFCLRITFNITSLCGRNTKYPFNNSHSRVFECIPP